jgi:integrase/recombinase XerD
MKHERFGQARVLTSAELDALVACLPAGPHHALATLMRFTACRVSEGLQLRWAHVQGPAVLFPAPITKRALRSREVPQHPSLVKALSEWRELWPWWVLKGADGLNGPNSGDYLFPSARNPLEHISRQSFDLRLRKAAEEAGLPGVSTHTFRRSGLTAASGAGVPLRTLQALSGHSSLQTLSLYLEVSEEQKRQAALAFA